MSRLEGWTQLTAADVARIGDGASSIPLDYLPGRWWVAERPQLVRGRPTGPTRVVSYDPVALAWAERWTCNPTR